MTEHFDKLSATPKRPPQSLPFDRLRIGLCHAHADRDAVRTLPEEARLTKDGVDCYALLDKV